MLLETLLERIPSDTEECVSRTRDRLNQNIREALRRETGLRFRRSGEEATEGVTVRIQVVPGLPVSLRNKPLDEKYKLAALIAPWKHTLEALRDAGKETAELVREFMADPVGQPLVEGFHADRQVVEFAEDLLRRTQGFDLAAWILEVNEDVMGTYRYSVPRAFFRRAEPQVGHIELYWGVIGLIARVLGVRVEDLAAVVLAHELAHAFTHQGLDIDGDFWRSEEFAASAHEVKEGLAQYYTWQVCLRLATQNPGAKQAYDKLLPHQPAAYQTHKPWTTDHTPEQVRLAMLRASSPWINSGGSTGAGRDFG